MLIAVPKMCFLKCAYIVSYVLTLGDPTVKMIILIS